MTAELRELTGGRGPTSASRRSAWRRTAPGPQFPYDQVKQQLRLQTDRPTAVREAIFACRKGGSVFVLGVFGGFVDKFPLGAVMNKGADPPRRPAARAPLHPDDPGPDGAGEIDTEHLATHVMPLRRAPQGYAMFKDKQDGCVRRGVPAGWVRPH